MARRFVKIGHSIFRLVLLLFLFVVGSYSVYALWDNQHIYAQAEHVQLEMLKAKPERRIDGTYSFAHLYAFNKDVKAWIEMHDTNINYPVVQGKDNFEYLNRDVFGKYALAGSIFLDSSNDPQFHDAYSILYGHNMAGERMFGGLDRYKEKEFFTQHLRGRLIVPDRVFRLDVIATVVVPASETTFFTIKKDRYDLREVFAAIPNCASQINEQVFQEAMHHPTTQILCLSSCSFEFTDARTLVLCRMVDEGVK